MTRRMHPRTIVKIMVMASAVTAADSQPAHAGPKSWQQIHCESVGHEWTGRTCEGCWAANGKGVKPGTKQTCHRATAPTTSFPCHCNGKTGQWEADLAGTPTGPRVPAGPAAPPPRGKAPTPHRLPPGTGAPLPLLKAPGS